MKRCFLTFLKHDENGIENSYTYTIMGFIDVVENGKIRLIISSKLKNG